MIEPAEDTATRFDQVYAGERLAVTRLVFLIVRSTPVAEDVAQEAFVRLYRRFDSVDNPAAFLRTVAVRLALQTMRRTDMERQRLTILGAGVPAAAGPELDETWEALGRLRPGRRAVLALRFYEDLPHDRIGELLGCSAATARSRMRRALTDLRKELPMIDEHELTRRVAESFHAHAALVAVDDEPFDPTRRPAPGAAVAVGRPAGRRARAVLVAAAVTAVAGLGTATWLVRDDDRGTATSTATPGVAPAPADARAPGWVPDGWTATDARWDGDLRSAPFVGSAFVGDAQARGDRAQLFGDPDDPARAMLVEIDGGVVGDAFPAGDAVTVRGGPGAAQTTDQVIELRFRPDGVAFVEWEEDGHTLRASYRGLDRDEAVAIVDGLRPRTGDLAGGFDLGTDDGGLRLLDEVLDPATGQPTEVGLVYEPTGSTAAGPFLTVMTTTGVGRPTVAYLHARLSGDLAPDGSARAWDPRGWYKVVAPDGAAVDVALQTFEVDDVGTVTARLPHAIPGVGSAEEVTRRVAGSVGGIAPSDLLALAQSAQVAAVDMPLLARVALDFGTVEVHGRDGAEAVCLLVGGDARCTGRDEAFDIEGVLAAQVEIDDQLYAVGVARTAPPTIQVGDHGTPAAAQTGADQGYHVALAPVPDDATITVHQLP